MILTALQVARLAYKHGIPLGDPLVLAVAVCKGESDFDDHALYTFGSDRSYGLWQINLKGPLAAERMAKYGFSHAEDLYDQDLNARIMADMSNRGTDWSQWGAYTDGGYISRGGMDAARPAVEQLKQELAVHPQPLPVPSPAPAPKPVPVPPAPAVVHLDQLRPGVQNSADVRVFQAALSAHGYDPGPADGWYGAQTVAACTAFQTAHGMVPATGVPGPLTVAALGLRVADAPPPTPAPVPPPPPKPAPKPAPVPKPDPAPATPVVHLSQLMPGVQHSADVRAFQKALTAHGFHPGPADGWYGQMTLDACAAFQRSKGDPGWQCDGIPGPVTCSRLGLHAEP